MAKTVERLILCIDVFLLAFAIGINSHFFYIWSMSPLSAEELERRAAGRD